MRRAIQKYLETPLSEKILRREVKEGGTVIVDADETGENLVFTVKQS
jgi:ATP-dependent Clp protease ATP-binding subunit ClpB